MKNKDMKPMVSRVLLIASPLWFLTAAVGMWKRVEPFSSWFYCFAWWAYILFTEAWLFRKGSDSQLVERPDAFFRLCSLSILVWLIFETFNFRLHNWHYLNLPASTPIRWFGYGLAFSTVLPGIFVSDRLLGHLKVLTSATCVPWKGVKHRLTGLSLIGACLLLAPIAWPRYTFPCVWLGFIFVLDPINYQLGAESLLSDLERGSPRRLYRLLAAGLWCGLLWECWNYWAGSKWVYTLPFFNRPKLFEMPVAGFLGFAPFALECFVMASTFAALRKKAKEQLAASSYRRLAHVLLFFGFALALAIFSGIDHFSVASYHR